MNGERELTAQERAALIAYHLARGEGLTVRQVCALTGLTRQGAHYLMQRLCRILPVARVEGQWVVCE